jgi:hypothetical protein
MQTTIISSHGAHCIRDRGSSVFKLPANAIVLMNCDNSLMWSDEVYDSRFWAFCTNSKLHLALAKDKITINSYGKFFKALETLNGVVGAHTNKFCVFADKSPDLLFQYEKQKFRSGIFKLPSRIVVKDSNNKGWNSLSSGMFEAFANKDPKQDSEEQRKIGAWLQVSSLTQLKKNEYFSVKNRKNFPSENYENNVLSKMVKDICEGEPDKMHVFIAFACRASQKVDMKLQQYSVTDNPYQAAIVVYDKVNKFLESKK